MEKKNVVPVWMSVVLLVLSIAGIVNEVVNAIASLSATGFTAIVVIFILMAVADLLAIFYCLMGYKKRAAHAFQAYCIVRTVERMITLYCMSQSFAVSGYGLNTAVQFFVTLIQCGIWFVLTIAKDLGRKKTLTLVGLLFVFAVVFIIALFLYYEASNAMGSLPGLVVYIITFIMFYAKYQDKASRGTK